MITSPRARPAAKIFGQSRLKLMATESNLFEQWFPIRARALAPLSVRSANNLFAV